MNRPPNVDLLRLTGWVLPRRRHRGDALTTDEDVGGEDLTRRRAHDRSATKHEVGLFVTQCHPHESGPIDRSS